jgi:RNA polymerase sigma factor (sigma-70 family)
MSTTTVGLFLRHLALSEEVGRLATTSDHDLLAIYAAERGQAAFTELVRRHGPMVLRTCHRLLGYGADAEDAFQATFVMLARQASQLRNEAAGRSSLGGWLHRVASRTAANVLTGASRRRNHELQVVPMPQPSPDPVVQATWNEVRPILDAELNALPDEPRRLLIACYLEDKTHAEAAAELGLPLGSMARRLDKARALLAERLVRRGVAVSAALLAVLLRESARGAGVPAVLLVHTVEAARTFSELAAGTVSANVARLVKGGLAQMAKGSMTWSMVCATCVSFVAAGLIACQSLKAWSDKDPKDERPAALDRNEPEKDKPRTDRDNDLLPRGALARLGTLRLRQVTGVYSLAFTGDGKGLITAGQGDLAHLWDVSSGRQLRQFGDRREEALCVVALSPDGRTLAGRVTGGSLCLWDATIGKLRHRLKAVRLVAGAKVPLVFSPDGKTLASRDGQTLRLWETATGKELLAVEQIPATILAYSADGKALIWSGYNGDLHLCDSATLKELRRWNDEKKRSISVLTRSPDDRLFTVHAPRGDAPGFARLWDTATDKEAWRLTDEKASIVAATFSPDGKILATGDGHGSVRLLDAATGKELRRCAGPGSAQCLAFSPDGKTLASGGGGEFGSSRDQMVHLWDVKSGREISRIGEGHQATVASVAFTPDGKSLVSSGWEGSLRVWNAATGEQRRQISPLGDELHMSGAGGNTHARMSVSPITGNSFANKAAALTSDGKTLILAAWERSESKYSVKVRRWDRETGQELRGWSREIAKGLPAYLVLSPDGNRVACMTVGSLPGQVYLWESATGKKLSAIAGSYPAFSADGRLLATAPLGGRADEPGSFTLWDAAAAKELCSAKLPEGRVYRLLFSPDGRMLVTASYGVPRANVSATVSVPTLIHLWPLLREESGKSAPRVGSPRLLAGGVPPRWKGAWAFSPDGRTLAVAGDDGSVRLLETAGGNERGRFSRHKGDVMALSFAPDGLRLASGSRDTTILVWDVSGSLQGERLRTVRLSDEELEACWIDLASNDAKRAVRAIWTLAAAPSQAVAYLPERLRSSATEAQLRLAKVPQLIRKLDDDAFSVRDKAKAELAKVGEVAEPALRQALAKSPSLEMRRSLEQLLKDVEAQRQTPSGASLRGVRVLEVLERIGTRQAREALKALTAGSLLGTSLTRESQAALERLDRSERQ